MLDDVGSRIYSLSLRVYLSHFVHALRLHTVRRDKIAKEILHVIYLLDNILSHLLKKKTMAPFAALVGLKQSKKSYNKTVV